jgi:hypothetical protein
MGALVPALNFHSLDDVISWFAARITVPPSVPAELAEAYRCSKAADHVQAEMLNSLDPPRWVERPRDREPV